MNFLFDVYDFNSLKENTLESLHAAVYEGADFIELDVVLTKDLQGIIIDKINI